MNPTDSFLVTINPIFIDMSIITEVVKQNVLGILVYKNTYFIYFKKSKGTFQEFSSYKNNHQITFWK